MPDNVPITQGANATPPDGTIVAADDVGGVKYQIVKLDLGGDGASSPVSGTVPISGAVTASGTVAVSGVAGNVAITAASLPLPTGAALDTTVTANGVLLGGVTEAAPGTDTASSGLNGRLQRIAQRLTSLIALLPASLGQKASASSLAVVVASDQSAIPVSQSGTWNVGTITNVVHIDDNAGSLTVDGSVTVSGTVAATQSGTWTIGNAAGASAVNVQDGGNSLTVDGTVTANAGSGPWPVTDNAGSLTVDNAGTFAVQATGTVAVSGVSGTVAVTQSGSWTVTESSNATDGQTTEPSTDLISGWDGQSVRSAYVQNVDGRNTLYTHDAFVRRLLEELLIEQRVTNAQLAKMLGPQSLIQRDMEPGMRLVS